MYGNSIAKEQVKVRGQVVNFSHVYYSQTKKN